MSDPRFPPLGRHIIEELPQRFAMWLTPFIFRLTDLFRFMKPPEGWSIIPKDGLSAQPHPTDLVPVFGYLNDPNGWHGGWVMPPSVRTQLWMSFTMPSDMAFYVQDEEGNQNAPTVYLRLKWMADTAAVASIRWELDWGWFDDGTTYDAQHRASAQGTFSTPGVAHQTVFSEVLTLTDERLQPGGILQIRFGRQGTNVADDYLADIYFIGADLIYYSDGLLTNERTASSTDPRFTKRPMFSP